MAGIKLSELNAITALAKEGNINFLVSTPDGSRRVSFDTLVESLAPIIGGSSLLGFGQTVAAKRKRYIQGKDSILTNILPEYNDVNITNLNSIHIDELYVRINDIITHFTDQTITLSNGTIGTNFYVVAHSDGTITLDTIMPTDGDKTKVCIGGFHYGRVRQSTTVSDVTVGIIPNSIWTLLRRPDCANPDAMVYIGRNLWGDIYLTRVKVSADSHSEGGSVYDSSQYGAIPGTGTENFSQYTFTEALAKVGKRLCSSDEFVVAADGSPEGLDNSNVNAWSATTNTSRCACGSVQYAVSSLNICDLVGNIWKWGNDKYELGTGAYGWVSLNGTKGDVYGPAPNGVGALLLGGGWGNGAHCGSRCVLVHDWPFYVHTGLGAWAVAENRS